MSRLFLDTGVLIAAARGQGTASSDALALLSDPRHQFLSSDVVHLELLPKAIYPQRRVEAEFYETYFASLAPESVLATTPGVVDDAFMYATRWGLSAFDALIVVAAQRLDADELVTTERPSSPLLRVDTVAVQSIYRPD